MLNQNATFEDLVDGLIGIFDLLIPLIFGLTLLVFVWGIVQAWIVGAADPVRVEEGKKIATAGVIGLFVMAAIWAIVELVQISFFG